MTDPAAVEQAMVDAVVVRRLREANRVLLETLERLEALAKNGYPTRSVSFEAVRAERRAALAAVERAG